MLTKPPEGGVLVGIEGVSGVGKTYYSRLVADTNDNVEIIPDVPDDGFGRNIKSALRSKTDFYNRHGYPTVEALLFMSRRLIELNDHVLPRLQKERTVLQDRCFYSTCVYSAILEHERQPERTVSDLFEEYIAIRSRLSFRPDINIFLYDDMGNCLERLEEREGLTFNESERDFMRRVHEQFPKIMDQQADVRKIDIRNKSTAEVVDRMTEIISSVQ